LVPLLATLLREDEVAAVREAAATSLGRFVLLGELGKIRPDPFITAHDVLLAACQDARECLDVQRRALESLAYVGNETVTDMIREAYGSPEEKVQVSAVFAMGRSADVCWARQVQQELCSPNPAMRYEAARACGELQLNDAERELEELADGADPEVQEAALWALGQIGGQRAQKVLEHYCDVEDEALRSAAQAALDELMFMHGSLSDLIARVDKEQ
ncbi:MAG: HEAT repeat domain-containing protein, partial [Chloroflexota bacterium]|nr:HEAT repeat domain-containing protein [Chloroflexota bacterium]